MRQYFSAQARMGVMTFGRAAAAHMMIDLDKFACNLKSKHDAAVSQRFAPELCILTNSVKWNLFARRLSPMGNARKCPQADTQPFIHAAMSDGDKCSLCQNTEE